MADIHDKYHLSRSPTWEPHDSLFDISNYPTSSSYHHLMTQLDVELEDESDTVNDISNWPSTSSQQLVTQLEIKLEDESEAVHDISNWPSTSSQQLVTQREIKLEDESEAINDISNYPSTSSQQLLTQQDINQKEDLSEEQFKCNICTHIYNTFDSRSAFDEHMKNHAEKKPYLPKCPICNWQCNFMRELAQHSKIKHQLKIYKCEKCGKSFTYSLKLSNHTRICGDKAKKKKHFLNQKLWKRKQQQQQQQWHQQQQQQQWQQQQLWQEHTPYPYPYQSYPYW